MVVPILVVGVGRCGTSAMAGVLRHLGVFMGDRFVGADEENPGGYWEDCDFKEVHADYLEGDLTYPQVCAALTGVIEVREALGIPWGFKDPRTAQMLPLYRRILLPEARYIWMQRDAADIQWSFFHSFEHRQAGIMQPWTAFQTWQIRHGMLEQWLPISCSGTVRGLCLSVEFTDLVSQPGWNIDRVIRFLGTEVSDVQRQTAIDSIRRE